ncbi:uncharacterized protein CLUP02_11886 [Colletotrichum lupini]|uniref:Uncharacterized protein n=1 Tax=Colletotrichum lupini TaxID=145971 RepID=A0A9Q8SZU1_9PEZI|nr:uncharacterized protein CLUP02_11886 [Colletotrichum lupini]UQC86385.1 hypothetical protein CLUP02_11886 [Colletotrichum lupini]
MIDPLPTTLRSFIAHRRPIFWSPSLSLALEPSSMLDLPRANHSRSFEAEFGPSSVSHQSLFVIEQVCLSSVGGGERHPPATPAIYQTHHGRYVLSLVANSLDATHQSLNSKKDLRSLWYRYLRRIIALFYHVASNAMHDIWRAFQRLRTYLDLTPSNIDSSTLCNLSRLHATGLERRLQHWLHDSLCRQSANSWQIIGALHSQGNTTNDFEADLAAALLLLPMSVLIAATMTPGCCIEPINQHYEGFPVSLQSTDVKAEWTILCCLQHGNPKLTQRKSTGMPPWHRKRPISINVPTRNLPSGAAFPRLDFKNWALGSSRTFLLVDSPATNGLNFLTRRDYGRETSRPQVRDPCSEESLDLVLCRNGHSQPLLSARDTSDLEPRSHIHVVSAGLGRTSKRKGQASLTSVLRKGDSLMPMPELVFNRDLPTFVGAALRSRLDSPCLPQPHLGRRLTPTVKPAFETQVIVDHTMGSSFGIPSPNPDSDLSSMDDFPMDIHQQLYRFRDFHSITGQTRSSTETSHW